MHASEKVLHLKDSSAVGNQAREVGFSKMTRQDLLISHHYIISDNHLIIAYTLIGLGGTVLAAVVALPR